MCINQFFVNQYLSIISLFISAFALLYARKTIIFTKRSRINDIRPSFEYKDFFGGYDDIGNKRSRKPYIEFILVNYGNKAKIINIMENTGKKVYCEKLNSTLNYSEDLKIKVFSNEMKHYDIAYNIEFYFKDIDNRIYRQIIKGKGTSPSITDSTRLNTIQMIVLKFKFAK